MLLSDSKCGDKIKIINFLGEDSILKKIEAMGLRRGDTFEILRIWGRNFLLKNGMGKLVVSESIAKNIEVELVGKSSKGCICRGCRRRWGWFKF